MTRIGWSVACVAILLAVGCGQKKDVAVVRVTRGAIQESFMERGRTRLAKVYPIAMPVTGRIGRIELEPGDSVKKGQELVAYDLVPFDQEVIAAKARVAELAASIVVKEDNKLEETALVETKATVKAAEESLKAADAEIEAESARSARASKELARIKELAESDVVTESELDDAQLDAETSMIQLRRQEFYRAALNALVVAVKLGPRFVQEYMGRKHLEREVIAQQLVQARAHLERAAHERRRAAVVSPVDGVVLERYEQGDSSLPAGHRLLLIGRFEDMEAIADVLTQDALRIAPGTPVELTFALGRAPVKGRVKLIEPAGFTKLSSLGVEQQRVNVIVSLEQRPGGVGVGYRLEARFLTGEKEDALTIPRYSVLQRPDQSYYVLKVVDGKLKSQTVTLGLQSDLMVEITDGLSEGDTIVSTPDTTLADGDAVSIRS
jgi:HlyD family secretion protein